MCVTNPQQCGLTLADPKTIVVDWLSCYASAIDSEDPLAVADTFLPEGWFRDVLTFTWDLRALDGRGKIASYLTNGLAAAGISELKLDERLHLRPRWNAFSPRQGQGVEGAFTFQTPSAHGRGYVHLLKDVDNEWKAWAVCMTLDDLKGHEEVRFESTRAFEGHAMTWSDVLVQRRAKIERDPHVLIVGGGHVGLCMAARFKQMDIPALVLERNARIGDNWRKRYPSVTLQTPRSHHEMLYAPFPTTWPLYTPRDKLADWLEDYANQQDLVTWTNSSIKGKPIYHEGLGRWEVSIDHEGIPKVLHPTHMVLATGQLGEPYMPPLKDTHRFQGEILHGIHCQRAQAYTGKKVVVVGAGNTAIDICQDLCAHRAASVTMIQRSSTCVISQEALEKFALQVYPLDIPQEVSDFRFSSIPVGLRKKVAQGMQQEMWEIDKEVHDKLRKGGLSLSMGPEGQGAALLGYERVGGLDLGGADLIASGAIKVKQGIEPVGFTEHTLILSDGSEIEADAVIMACGFHEIREVNKKLFGENIINRTREVFGIDKEGESKGAYRPSGHPGLWFATGDFWVARSFSKPLAIQIKSIELRLTK
ncbi:unnamed protein product [Somion occarium]|uniref:Flavin-containing monooxygenase n=1 Tax=Somion occarium TaxID=3059160 RepID=A0ABP1DK42_9APHY